METTKGIMKDVEHMQKKWMPLGFMGWRRWYLGSRKKDHEYSSSLSRQNSGLPDKSKRNLQLEPFDMTRVLLSIVAKKGKVGRQNGSLFTR